MMTTDTLERPQTETVAIDRSGCSGGKRNGRHGDANAYSHGCRCPDALTDATRYRRELARRNIAAGRGKARTRRPKPPKVEEIIGAGMVAARPTADRLRILAGLGYDWPFLADRLGWDGWDGIVAVMSLAYMRRPDVHPDTADQVRAVYGDLATRPVQPCGDIADRAMAVAVRNGWGIVDVEVLRRALIGAEHRAGWLRQNVAMTTLEKMAVVFTGEVMGLSPTAIGRAARMSFTAVNTALAA